MKMAPMDAIWLFSSKDIAFARLFVATHLPPIPTLPPFRNAVGIGYTSKNYLKWWAIQLVIHSTAGE